MTRTMIAALMVSGALAATAARSEDEPAAKAPADAKAAFARLKGLVGRWTNEGEPEGEVHYRLTGGGSALVETLMPGSAHEMISVYHLDGDDLVFTHYCAVGNQPRLKLDRAASTPDHLKFVFNGGTNLDPEVDMHIHEGSIRFVDADTIESEWVSFQDGRKGGTLTYTAVRR